LVGREGFLDGKDATVYGTAILLEPREARRRGAVPGEAPAEAAGQDGCKLMATTSAIAATTAAILHLLRSGYNPADFYNASLDFQVYVANDFLNPMDEGVSLLLYRIYHDGTNRTPAGRVTANGRRARTMLPLELRFLVTAWAKTASLQT
jgi:hypothetical protein